jgi:hypothetical protein
MMPHIQIDFLLYKMEAGKKRVGSKRKRERKEHIKGVRDGE